MSVAGAAHLVFDVDLSNIGISDKDAAKEKSDYVDHLAALNLERLKTEPEQLQAEFDSVQKQIEEYAFANYRPFIQAGRSTNTIQDQLAAMSGELAAIGAQMQPLTAATEDFQRAAEPILAEKTTINAALSNHVQLTEILEVRLSSLFHGRQCIESNSLPTCTPVRTLGSRRFRS